MTTAAQARAHPGLKLQTPIEARRTTRRAVSDRKRWLSLFTKPLNKYFPTK